MYEKSILQKNIALLSAAMLLGTVAPVYAQEPAKIISESNIVYLEGMDTLAGNMARYALIYKIGGQP